MHPILGIVTPSTRIWKNLVFFCAGALSNSVVISVALCLQYFKCWVIFAFSNSTLQKLHTPFETSLVAVLFVILFPLKLILEGHSSKFYSYSNYPGRTLISGLWDIRTSNLLKTRTITCGVIILRVHTASM